MQMINSGYRGLSVLVDLNWDRLFYVGTLAAGLMVGTFLGSVLAP